MTLLYSRLLNVSSVYSWSNHDDDDDNDVCVCGCVCDVLLCVTDLICHLCVTVYCGIPVDHQCVSEVFKNNKTFITKCAFVSV